MKKNKKSKMILSATTLVLLAAYVGQVTYAEVPNANANENANENENESENIDVIVVFKNKNAASKEKLVLTNSEVSINHEFKNVPGFSVSLPPEEVEELKNNPNVELIENDIAVSINADTKDWGISTIKADQSWTNNYTGKGVKIAVLDTGIDTEHNDLIVKGGASFVSYTKSYDDDQGHGTHVGGIIGARNNGFGTVGTAPDANLYAVKVLDDKGDGLMSNVIAGIDWAITNKMDIVNLSLGAEAGSSALKSIIDKAYANDVLVVAAAGNDGTVDGKNDTVDYPGQYSNAITVAATDSNNIRATFSSTGAAVNVSAPGVNILSTYLDNQYAYMSGTSMATPYVAGTLALYKEANPTLSNNQLRSVLESNVIDLGPIGKDNWYGLGLVQAPIKLSKPPVIETETETAMETEIFTTNTSVTTDKSSYKLRNNVYITAEVKDQNGNALSNANVIFKITQPNGVSLSYKGITNTKGIIKLTIATSAKSATGTYTVNLSTTKTDYTANNTTTTFTITKE